MMSGPEATAGSTPIFLKKIGITVPEMLESSIAAMSAMPMQPETPNAMSAASPRSRRYAPMSANEAAPRIAPFISPTRASFQTSFRFCAPVVSLSIRTRIVTASDCVPTLPAISSTSDWKHTMSVSCATTPSKRPTTLETTIPSPSSTSSHGRRLRTLCTSVSLRSSSAERPASRA